MTPYHLDTTGLRCPEPIMMLRKQLREMADGEQVIVTADDISTTWDIPSFCRHMDHTLIEMQSEHPPYTYQIQKGQRPKSAL